MVSCELRWTLDPDKDVERFKDIVAAAIPYFEKVSTHQPDLAKMDSVAKQLESLFPLNLCDKLPRSTKPQAVYSRREKMRKLNVRRLANRLKRL